MLTRSVCFNTRLQISCLKTKPNSGTNLESRGYACRKNEKELKCNESFPWFLRKKVVFDSETWKAGRDRNHEGLKYEKVYRK